MKRILIITLVMLFLVGCAGRPGTHINRVTDRWGDPAEVEDRGDTIVYYYYFQKGKVSALTGDMTHGYVTGGWVVVEIITDRDGKILKVRKYWKQPKREGRDGL